MEVHPIRSGDGVSSELRVFSLGHASSVVLIFPAMGVPARKYDGLASELHKQGLQVVTAELRGIESSSVRAGRGENFGYKEMVELDFPLALQHVEKLFPKQPIFLIGHSLGGQLALLMMSRSQALKSSMPAGLILSASCSIYYRGWALPKNIFILAFTQLAALISGLLGYFPGKIIGFGGREARTVISDWAKTARTGEYSLSNTDFDYEPALKSLSTSILAINYADDDFAPQRATELLLEKTSATEITRQMFSRNDLGSQRADHFSWLKHPEAVAAATKSWIDSVRQEIV